jgi:hypothetical protein
MSAPATRVSHPDADCTVSAADRALAIGTGLAPQEAEPRRTRPAAQGEDPAMSSTRRPAFATPSRAPGRTSGLTLTPILTLACALALALALAGAASAQTVTVTTVDDVVDFAAPKTVAQLPGPDGRVSFREACTAANNTPGPQTIAFAIPASEWWLMSTIALLRQEHGIFLLSDDATTVDFTTQTDFTGDTNPNGREVGIYGLEPNAWGVASIYVTGDGCTIEGLDRVMQRGHAVQLVGNDNRVIGCTISGPLHSAVYITGGFGGAPATGNVVGGTGPGEGNVLSAGGDGVRIDAPAAGNVVIGNRLGGTYHGVQVRGSQYTTTADGNRIGGPTPAERNVIAGAGKYGEEGFPDGSQVNVEWAVGTVIEGNHIGTTADGMAAAGGKGPVGIELRTNAAGTIVRGNLISGIVVQGVNHYAGQTFGTGIVLGNGSEGSIVQGNRIGTDATGQGPLPNLDGVTDFAWLWADPAAGARIGGTEPGQANTIAFNQRAGVQLATQVSGVTLSGNSIHSNGLLGIDLLPAGPTPNDPLDADTGPNGLQNRPLLLSATIAPGGGPAGAEVAGELDSLPGQTFVVECFANAACDASGSGEGETFLGSVQVATDGAGHAAFAAQLPEVAAGSWLTATATHVATGNTSEFSACLQAGEGPWTDLGFAKAGTNGVPHLAGSGPLTAGTANALLLTDAAPSTPATLVLGFSMLGAPFRDGTLVPLPQFLVPLATDAAGSATLPFAWPAGVPSGTVLYLQDWIQDAGASYGLSASNGLMAATP